MSNFNKDLQNEQILGKYLDNTVYPELNLNISRCKDLTAQYKGIDFILSEGSKTIKVDEKAQLTYLNKQLPTFAFEISYKKNGLLKEGWLYDPLKETEEYFLITGIYTKDGENKLSGSTNIESCIIHRINRQKLIDLLKTKGLDFTKLKSINQNLREKKQYRKQLISELNRYSEGYMYFTEWLTERPINLVLKLQFLLDNGVAKKIWG